MGPKDEKKSFSSSPKPLLKSLLLVFSSKGGGNP